MQKPTTKNQASKQKGKRKMPKRIGKIEFDIKNKWLNFVFSSIAVVVVFCTVYALILPAITLTTQTTGAQTNSALSHLMYSSTSSASRRAYLEYSLDSTQKSHTFGVMRKSIIYVYAYAGETICLGSDIVHSRIDENDKVLKEASGADIVVIGPDGTKYSFDNDEVSGLGYIGTYNQEKNGANYKGSGNKNGYTPHEFQVRSTGVYEIRFHSFDANNFSTKLTTGDDEPHLRPRTNYNLPNTGTAGTNGDPVPIGVTGNQWGNTGATVGAFDATVIRNGKVQTGRAYADYLALNMGANLSSSNPSATFYANFYIVTSDGYIYKSTFDLDPYGFIFFANSRGVVDTDTGYSAYRSARAYGQLSGSNEMDLRTMPYTIFTPQNESTIFDKTYRIFFEEPDEALQGTLFQRAFAPEKVQNIEFIGSKEGNVTYVGNGGYFKFDTSNASSVTITISFSDYNEAHGTNYKNVTINANVTDGTNYVYWDGNDADGVTIPEGWYREGKIDVSVNAHTGEIHFPFLDVENGKGVSFERVNKIYDYVDGVLTDVTDQYEDSKNIIYYNNETLDNKRNNPNYVEATEKTHIADNIDASNGVISTEDNKLMRWASSRGDYTMLDVWTYAVANQEFRLTTDIIIEDLDGYYTVNLNGLVFFDKDESTYYDIVGGDFPLEDVVVTLDYYYCGTRWENIERDDEGTVTRLCPAAHKTTVDNGDGTYSEAVDYYYHNYEVHLEEDGQYHLYQFAQDDRLHEGDLQPALDKNGQPIIISIEEIQVEDEQADETKDNFLVWIPVHRETTTDAIGEYFFSGVLVNENFYNPPNELVDDIVITVRNPQPDLYNVTTEEAVTGDFGTTGTEIQTIHLSDLYQKIEQDKGDTDKTNFFYSMADVGYYFETHEPPLVISKRWGTIADSNDVESITFRLQGYADSGDTRYICYEKDVVIDYHSWMKELTDLPAKYTPEGGEPLEIQYRVVSETFVKGGGDTYIYTYYWDEAQPYGTYERVLTFDEDGKPLTTELLEESKYPYETFIAPVDETNTNDYIYIENWTKKTSSITITKFSADDNVTRLKDATFLLEKEDSNTGNFETVMTANGRYAVTTDETGTAVFRGLTQGTYRITEIAAPLHYEKINDIIFTIDENGDVDNAKITGEYDSGFYINLYDELSEAPVSKLTKYDQYGNTVSGATFAAYPADNSYNYNANDEPAFTLVTGEDGTATMYIERADGTVREMYIAELVELLGSDHFVLVETGVPDGYRKVGEAHLKVVGSGVNSYVLCENPYDSGVWAKPNAIVYATDTLQIVNPDDFDKLSNKSYVDNTGKIQYTHFSSNGQISTNGTLFAVVLKRNGAEPDVTDIRDFTGEGWQPVYGDDISGYHVVGDYDSTIDAVVDVAQRNYAVEFTPSVDDNAMLAHIENFPGHATRYYTYFYDNELDVTADDPQYLVAYYFTTASSAEAATADNTVQVRSHGFHPSADSFDIKWSTNINAANISNMLFVQKRDTEDFLVNNAVFGLYKAVADSQGKGYYVAKDSNNDTVYISLSDDNQMATVYNGYLNSDGMLVLDEEVARSGTYTINTDGCVDLDELSKEQIGLSGGYISSESGKAGYITVTDEEGDTYTIKPAIDALDRSCVVFTHDKCQSVGENGTGHFGNLKKGNYMLKEICAPPGYQLNYTNTEVIVGNEVYANAGTTTDGVRVGNGAGYLISTMNVFGSIGDINESLSYIAAALRLNASDAAIGGFVNSNDVQNWEYVSLDQNNTTKYIFTGEETTGPVRNSTVLYLRYNGDANSENRETKTLFDYTVSPEAANNPDNVINSLLFWTESGWSDLAIFQHYSYATKQGVENANTTFTDLTIKRDANGNPIYDGNGNVIENDLSHLFSSSTFVSYEDESDIGIKIKKVSSTTNEPLADAQFVLYYTEGGANYYYALSDDDHTPEWHMVTGDVEKSDFALTSDELGEISFNKLLARTYYLEEIRAPEGYEAITQRIIVSMVGGEIVAMREDGTPLKTAKPEGLDESGEYVYTVIVPNNGGFLLPNTGGNVNLYYTFGTLLTVSAAALMCGYVLRRRKERRVAG